MDINIGFPLLILFVSCLQDFHGDRIAGLVFIAPAIAHELMSPVMGGWTYYITGSLFCLGIIWVYRSFLHWSKMAERLSRATLVVMAISAGGFGMWYAGCDPMAFNYISKACFLWILYIIIDEGGIHAGISETIGQYFSVYSNVLPSVRLGKGSIWKE